MKKPLFVCAITLVIATLLVTSAVSIPTVKVSSEKSSDMMNVGKIKEKLLKDNIRAIESQEPLKMTLSSKTMANLGHDTINPLVFNDVKAYGAKLEHAVLSDSMIDSTFNPGTGTQLHYLPLAFDYSNATSLEEYLVWAGSNDSGCTFEGFFYLINATSGDPLGTSYPDISYWGLDEGGTGEPVWYTTWIPENNAPELHFMWINGNPSNFSNFQNPHYYFDLSSLCDDLSAIAITCEDKKQEHEFGSMSFIIDITALSLPNAPCILFANASDPNGGIVWYWPFDCGFDGKTDIALDRISSSAPWDIMTVWTAVDELDDAIIFHWNDFETMEQQQAGGYVFIPGILIEDVAIAMNDGHFIALSELWFWNETYDMWDKDIWAWHWNTTTGGSDGVPTYNIEDLIITPVANRWPDHENVGIDWNETSPNIEYIGGTGQDKSYFVATYQWNGTTQMIYTYDAGWHWTTNYRDVPYPGDPVSSNGDSKTISGEDVRVEGFRSGHIADGGKKFIYTHSNQDDNPDFSLRFGDLWIRGDCNDDVTVDLGDVVFLVNYLFKSDPRPLPPSRGDLNFDGNIDLGDVVYLVSYLFKGFPAPPHNLGSCP